MANFLCRDSLSSSQSRDRYDGASVSAGLRPKRSLKHLRRCASSAIFAHSFHPSDRFAPAAPPAASESTSARTLAPGRRSLFTPWPPPGSGATPAATRSSRSGGISVFRNRYPSSCLLGFTSPVLALQPAFLRFPARPGFPAGRDGFCRPAEQPDQAVPCVLAVALLRAEPSRLEDQHAFAGHPLPPPANQAFPHRTGQGPGMSDVEAKLDRRRHLVDVLPPGTRGAYEPFLDFAFVEEDRLRDADHGFILAHGSLTIKASSDLLSLHSGKLWRNGPYDRPVSHVVT